MRKILLYTFLITFSTILNGCKPEANEGREIYNEDFKWSITIPKGFEEVSAKEHEKRQQRGTEAIENTFGGEITNQAKNIFTFKDGQSSYFEANYQLFDESVYGNHLETFEAVSEILYKTFISQIPGTKVDEERGTVLVDSLDFQLSKMKITYPNNIILFAERYSRLFNDKEFTVNIMYKDKEKGEQMKQSLLNSKFKK